MKKTTRRKVWNKNSNPVAFAVMGSQPTPESDLLSLRIRELYVIEALEKHQATLTDLTHIRCFVRITHSLAKNGVGIEALPLAEQLLTTVNKATPSTPGTPGTPGTIGFPKEQINQLRELLAYHEAQRMAISRAHYEKTIYQVIHKAATAQNNPLKRVTFA